MRRLHMLALTVPLSLGLVGCELLQSLLNLDALSILGIMPKAGFSNASSDSYGKLVMAVSAEDDDGFTLAPPVDLLQFRDGQGNLMDIGEEEELPGSDAGTFALLVDGSSSMDSTDSERFREDAARLVASRIEACSEHWDQALLRFSTGHEGGKYEHSAVLAPYGSSAEDIADNTHRLDADGATPLWDATYEVLVEFSSHAESHEQRLLDAEEPAAETYGRALVVISDGADTASAKGLTKVITKAQNTGIAVHVIGLGPASDAEHELGRDDAAISDLRRLALKTGGTYGYVSSAADLPVQADAIAAAVCNGYTQVTLQMDNPPASGSRTRAFVGIANTPLVVPFSFTAP